MEVEKKGGCQLLGTAGLITQMTLGVLSFMVLIGWIIVKRHQEKPKRLWKVFLMDSLKQLFSQLITHFLNVALAILLSSNEQADACIWYFITYIMDTTAGVGLCYLMITFFEKLFESRGNEKFKTGNYYQIIYPNITTFAVSSTDVSQVKKSKPKVIIDYPAYIMQLLLWMFIVCISKSILYVFQAIFANFLQNIAEFFFAPISNQPTLELIIIMVIIPLVMNAFCFWVQDSFLKKTTIKREERDILMGVIYENEQAPQPKEFEKYIEFQQINKAQPAPIETPTQVPDRVEINLEDQPITSSVKTKTEESKSVEDEQKNSLKNQ